MLVNSRKVEIEFGDCDPAGIVYYPNYFRMFDAATAHLFEAALGMKKIAWTRHYGIVGIPMVDTGATFLKPARFGDVVTITSTITGFKRSSFEVGHQVFLEDILAVEARETRVWTGRDPEDADKLKAVPLPADVVAALSRGDQS